MRGWSACHGGFRAAVRRDRYPANPVGSLHPPRGEHPTPDERAPMTVARGHPRVGVGSSVARQRAIGLDVDISWLPTAAPSERNDGNLRAGSGLARLTQNESRRSKKER